MIFRLSHKLNAKIKAGTLPSVALDENPFADWSAHLFVAGRTQYLLLSNTRSLYSTVMYGRGITTDSHFIECAWAASGSSWKPMARRSSTAGSSCPPPPRFASPRRWIAPSRVR